MTPNPFKQFFRTFGATKPQRALTARRGRRLDVSEREWRRLRALVFVRDGYTCVYCGAKPPRSELEADHVVPRTSGGLSIEGNLATACGRCNLSKGAKALDQWRAPA